MTISSSFPARVPAQNAADYPAPTARVLVAAIFLASGLSKLTNPAAAAALMASKNMPATEVLLWLTIVLEIATSLAVIIGYRTRAAALILFVWMIPVTIVFHGFWAVEAAQMLAQRTQFLKNLAIMGGLLMIAIHGSGAFSIDRRKKVFS